MEIIIDFQTGLYGVVDRSQKSGEKATPETPDSDGVLIFFLFSL